MADDKKVDPMVDPLAAPTPPVQDQAVAAQKAKAQSTEPPPDLTLAQKADAKANNADLTSTPNTPGIGVPPLQVEPVGSQADDVVGEVPGDDWVQVVFRGAGISGQFSHIPPPTSTDQQIDQVGPSGRSYHFRQNVVSLVHPDDADYFLDHEALEFEAPDEDEGV